jgi:hypothetical protein
MLETSGAFAVVPPIGNYPTPAEASQFACSVQQRPLFRLYNNRFAQNDSNHRYVVDAALYRQMEATGWTGEGAQMCVLR